MPNLKFKKETTKEVQNNENTSTWKVLIVDDEPEVHNITKTVLSNFELEGKKLEFISAYSGKESLEILSSSDDIAVVLLDVIMETNDAGLIVAHKIREELNNSHIRIILRTGQPGNAPEEDVIVKYKINDYKEKTELTSKKLFSTMVTALRSYQDLSIIEQNKKGLEKIIKSTKSISEEHSLELFAQGVLIQLISILNFDSNSIILNNNSAISIEKTTNKFKILASTGVFADAKKFEDINPTAQDLILNGIEQKRIGFLDDHYIGYFKFNEHTAYIIYISGCSKISRLDKDLTEIFSSNISVAFNNLALNNEIFDTQKDIIERLGNIVEKRSKEASNHVRRVADFSYQLAKDYGLDEKESSLIRMASPMHDVGKIGISDEILLKPGRHTPEEFEIMKKHSSIGYRMLKDSKREILKAGAIIAYEHHEKFDGTGYPLKKKGSDIHIYGRVTAVADVFDALYHKRCYKEAWPIEEIISLFKEERGKHFDPELVDIVFSNLNKYEEIINPTKDKEIPM